MQVVKLSDAVQAHKKERPAQCTCIHLCIHPFVFTKYLEDSYGKALKLARAYFSDSGRKNALD